MNRRHGHGLWLVGCPVRPRRDKGKTRLRHGWGRRDAIKTRTEATLVNDSKTVNADREAFHLA